MLDFLGRNIDFVELNSICEMALCVYVEYFQTLCESYDPDIESNLDFPHHNVTKIILLCFDSDVEDRVIYGVIMIKESAMLFFYIMFDSITVGSSKND